VAEEGNSEARPRRSKTWIRVLLIAGGIGLVLLVLFHRPILRHVTRSLAIRIAARQNVKLDFQIDGSILSNLILRNVHATGTGPAAIQSIDADLIRADYSLPGLLFHGWSELVENVEVHSASVVLAPESPAKAKPPPPNEKIRLPALFPKQLHFSHVNLTVQSPPQDFVVRDLNLDLDPTQEGQFRVDALQIPGVHTWTNITATTSYTNRDLFFRNLTLDQNNQFRVVNLDASQIRSKVLSVGIDGSVAHGNFKGTIRLQEIRSSLQLEADINGTGFSLAELSQYVDQSPKGIMGDLASFTIKGQGTLEVPRSWNGKILAEVHDVRQKELALDQVTFNVEAAHGVATIGATRLVAGNNHAELSGALTLPDSIDGFGRTPTELKLSVVAPDLQPLTGFLSPPITGSAQAAGKITVKDQTLLLHLAATGTDIGFEKGTAKRVAATIEASKETGNRKAPYFSNLTTHARADLKDLHYDQYVVDSVNAETNSAGDVVTIDRVAMIRNANDLTMKGKYTLPPPGRDFIHQPIDLSLTFRSLELGDYFEEGASDKVTGLLQGEADLHLVNGSGRGQFNIYGANVSAKNLLVKQLSAQAAMSGQTIFLNDFTALLGEKDYVGGHGTISLEQTHHYTGALIANIADLSTLQPVLKASGNSNQLAGTLMINWQGNGDVTSLKNTGQLKLTLDKGRYGSLQALASNIDATYSPEALDIPIVFFGSDQMNFQAVVQAKGSTLEISKVQVDQGQAKYAAGYVSLPFIWRNLGTKRPLFPSDGKLTATLQSDNLDLKKLAQNFGVEPVVSGNLSLKFDAQGTLAKPVASLQLLAVDLRSEKFQNLEPARFNLSADLNQGQLAISGQIQQAKIQPIAMEARLPLDLPKTIEEKKLDDQTPITAKIRLPRTTVNFVRQFVPAVQQIDGDLALDVNVNGTIAKPVLSGAGDATINVMRFINPTLPALQDFKARFDFNRDTLSLGRFGGQLAGGPFTLSGRISFPKLTEPEINLQFRATDVLVARNDSLTARADADVRVNGPLKSASVTGRVALTNSQFLKNIDLIPIGLPGRPAPEPPASRPTLSFPDPPLRDWKFDVAIKTKDPFLIRGNLANGGAIVDLKLTGTGLRPGLQGTVHLQDVEATLPFSRLAIDSGYLYFTPDDPLNPRIDLHGTSLVRDYTVRVYVYGTSLSPEAIFTSEPPLPQEEIISLLATGTTRQELTGNNSVLAGRAAMLLIQQLYRKIFKQGQPTQTNSAFNRLQIDLGTVDPKTGQQTAEARFKIDEHFMLVGDIEVGGDFRGTVKYLLRFR